MNWDNALAHYMVKRFILNPNTSSLDHLPYAQRERFRTFKWTHDDFPGIPIGPNELLAREMNSAFNKIRPERRPNTGKTAIVTKSTFKSLEHYIINQLQLIPNFPHGCGHSQPSSKKLNKHALKSFLEMRKAALDDQIPLIVLSSDRSSHKAAQNAAKSGNPSAVAKFSSHMLGLAIDLQMSYKIEAIQHKYKEITTKPMQNVVDMRQSPIHKWMFIYGSRYGWYPYQQEPWHWEYNPPGFKEVFFSELKFHIDGL